MANEFSLTRVATKNIVLDSFQSIRNLFGLRLRGYEGMINHHVKELIEQMNKKYLDIKWWRMSINPLTNGSVMITLYGEYNE